ncbi:MAG: hypothetical protein ACK55I_19875, partial [bacterium]
ARCSARAGQQPLQRTHAEGFASPRGPGFQSRRIPSRPLRAAATCPVTLQAKSSDRASTQVGLALRAGPSGPQPTPPLPAGGTTAGLPDLAAPGEAGWVADVMLWHLLCQK